MDKLNQTIDNLKLVLNNQILDNISDECILNNAVKIYLKQSNDNSDPKISNIATNKQKSILKKIGYSGNLNNISKKEAYVIISENLKK